MKHNNILGKGGLTVTSANHVANIAKEMYEAAESRLGSLKLYSRDYLLAVNGNTYRVENESEKEELQELPAVLKEIGDEIWMLNNLDQFVISTGSDPSTLKSETISNGPWSVESHIDHYKETHKRKHGL